MSRTGLTCFRSGDPRRLPVADAVMVMPGADLVVVVVMRVGRGRRGRQQSERGDGECGDESGLHGGFLWMMPEQFWWTLEFPSNNSPTLACAQNNPGGAGASGSRRSGMGRRECAQILRCVKAPHLPEDYSAWRPRSHGRRRRPGMGSPDGRASALDAAPVVATPAAGLLSHMILLRMPIGPRMTAGWRRVSWVDRAFPVGSLLGPRRLGRVRVAIVRRRAPWMTRVFSMGSLLGPRRLGRGRMATGRRRAPPCMGEVFRVGGPVGARRRGEVRMAAGVGVGAAIQMIARRRDRGLDLGLAGMADRVTCGLGALAGVSRRVPMGGGRRGRNRRNRRGGEHGQSGCGERCDESGLHEAFPPGD